MKQLLTVLFVLITGGAFAQHVANTFQAVENTNISMQKLNDIYPPAIASDSAKAVFKGSRQGGFINAYKGMMQDLETYMKKNSFTWKKPTPVVVDVYFAPDGGINYFLVNLVNAGLENDDQKKFLALLNGFIKDYKISYTAGTRFAQCTQVLFKNN